MSADGQGDWEVSGKDCQLLKAVQSGKCDRVLRWLQRGASTKKRYTRDGYTVLHAAVQHDHLAVVKQLIQHGADPSVCNSSGESPLRLAVMRGNKDVVAALLDAKPDVNAMVFTRHWQSRTPDRTLLHLAADKWDLPMMQLLLAAGACADTPIKDHLGHSLTLLHVAVKANHMQAASLLISNGAAVDAACSQGYTQLHYASEKGHLEMARLLLDAKASVDAVTRDKRTPLSLASRAGNEQLVELLLRSGAQPRTQDSSGKTALHVAADHNHVEVLGLLLGADSSSAHVDVKCGAGQTALHLASSKGHVKVVQLLLDSGAQPSVQNGNRRSALHLAAEHNHVEVVRLLLIADPAPAHVNAMGSWSQQTALHVASSKGHREVVQLLLDGGAQPSVQDGNKQSALHVAADHGHAEVVRLLLGADPGPAYVNAVGDWDKQTALHLASSKGYSEVVQLLLDGGAQPSVQDGSKQSALHVAASANHAEVVRLLLGADPAPAHVNATSSKRQTALHLASSKGGCEAVQMLLNAGADADTKDLEGSTPLLAAAGNSHTAVVQLLLAAGADPTAATAWGTTAVYHAAVQGNLAMLQALLAAMSPEQARGFLSVQYSSLTALLWAAEKGHTSCVEALLAAGADPTAATAEGKTAVYHAAVQGNLTMLQALLAAMTPGQRSRVLTVQCCGSTPLLWATEKGHTSCVSKLLAAGADPDQRYGAEAANNSGSLEGASVLHRAVLLERAELVPLLATPGNLSHVWKGDTPLHLALSAAASAWNQKTVDTAVQMAQALVAARSPAGVANSAGATAMSLAVSSRPAALRALLPAMVRHECEVFKEHQQEKAPQPQRQGQRQVQEQGQAKQEALAALPEAVVDSVYAVLMAAPAAGGLADSPYLWVSSFKGVMEVLGEAAAGSLLQQLLGKGEASSGIAAGSKVPLLLVQMMHKGWFSEVLPLMQQRWKVANRMDKLLAEPAQHQQPEETPTDMPCAMCSCSRCPALKVQALAAARAGRWPLFVQLLDQLTGLHEACGAAVMCELERQQGSVGAPSMAKVCEVLLGAWWAARQQVMGRMRQELACAVLEAVQAAKERWAVAGNHLKCRGSRVHVAGESHQRGQQGGLLARMCGAVSSAAVSLWSAGQSWWQ